MIALIGSRCEVFYEAMPNNLILTIKYSICLFIDTVYYYECKVDHYTYWGRKIELDIDLNLPINIKQTNKQTMPSEL